ncbi:MAG: hypothetical protein ACT6FC_02605 [Methanosarcinaceae archaeon]
MLTRQRLVESEGIFVPQPIKQLWAENMYLNIGIDIAINIHEVYIVDDSGEQIGKFMKLKNSKKKD